MIQYIAYNDAGKEIQRGSCAEDVFEHLREAYKWVIQVNSLQEHLNSYLHGGEILPIPDRPSEFHYWDWTSKAWLPDLDHARTARQAEVGTEFIRRDLAPITYAGTAFDANAQARENIGGTLSRLLRGDGLPGGWIGWRDHANAMHWATDDAETVQTHLAALSRAIEDRKQALLVAAWTHKAALDALATVEAILAYDITAAWPV